MRRNKKNPKTNAGASDVAEATASRKQKPTMAMLKEPPPPGTQNRRRRCWKSHPFPETSRTTTIERCDAETYVDQETPNKSQMLKRKKELHNRTDGGSESLARVSVPANSRKENQKKKRSCESSVACVRNGTLSLSLDLRLKELNIQFSMLLYIKLLLDWLEFER
ncbi:hypothetical protein YC2023_007893 [Brassica napus]